MLSFAAMMQWFNIGKAVFQAGLPVFQQIQGVLANNGIQADTDALEADMIDADRRKAIADREAQAQS
jgi:hypothetical protein